MRFSIFLTSEQKLLLLLIAVYHTMTYVIQQPRQCHSEVRFHLDSTRRWNDEIGPACFSGTSVEPPKPWTSDHPCVIDRKPGNATKEFPSNPTKSILLIEHSPAAVHKMAYQVMNTLNNLPTDWKIQIIYPQGTRLQLEVWLEEYIQLGQVQLLDVIRPGFQRFPDYNNMLRSTELWERLWGDWVLILHTDSGICPLNSEFQLDDFFCYDSIGAPWAILIDGYPLTTYQGGNGGFVLRRRTSVLDVIRNHPMNETEREKIPEDVWYHSKFLLDNATLPSVEAMKYFSVEVIFGWSYGWHKLWLFSLWGTAGVLCEVLLSGSAGSLGRRVLYQRHSVFA
eukprot:TRINITY_DN3078_c0_g1_i2.p1 TRINITY_DN3078_c0_g1~~TRINITY_DN3078_c0_g1_i2.p1  ORF type:complete len:338 (+),score=45.14 TRINITY_DN3078_c0_g1_i2:317-1330(+)